MPAGHMEDIIEVSRVEKIYDEHDERLLRLNLTRSWPRCQCGEALFEMVVILSISSSPHTAATIGGDTTYCREDFFHAWEYSRMKEECHRFRSGLRFRGKMNKLIAKEKS